MKDSLLNGFRALDLTDDKGMLCGKILGALGVDVIKVERPGGDPSRNIPPFYGNILNPEKSLFWLAYNTDKRSITLNLEDDKGKNIFKKLVSKADFVLETFSPGYLERLGLDYENLKRINQRVILTSITPFGKKGPYSKYKGSDLVTLAMSGVMAPSGYPDRPPICDPPGSTYFMAGAAAACGTLISHYFREKTGQGQQVDISITEVAANRDVGMIMWWEVDGILKKRNGSISEFGRTSWKNIWQCKNGYIFWILLGGKVGAPANRALCHWMKEDGIENPLKDVSNWEEYDMAAVSPEMHVAFETAIGNFFLQHTKEEINEEGLRRGLNAVIVASPADVLENQQLASRKYWTDLKYPEMDTTFKQPSRFFLSNETENYVSLKAPNIGEHNDEIYGKELGLSNTEIETFKRDKVI
jgi:crotonobetainyl-CoA:carnitine CoA-transferase CaiB-like acyl-CoA transferase